MPAPSASSLIDLVDERDRPIGRIRRSDARRPGQGFRVVHVLVHRGEDILLQQLAGGRERHGLLWGSSVAGYLHAGESYESAARRRATEEVGPTSEPVLEGTFAMADEGATKFVAVFRAQAEHVENRLPDHVAALRFWGYAELDEAIRRFPDDFTPTFLAVWEFLTGR